MRKLSPFKAVSHALNSVWSYRNVALRIGMVWVPVMLIAGLLEYFAGSPDPAAQEQAPQLIVQLLSGVVSLIAVCSIAVNWHRFILRDEMGTGLRIDGNVLRYAGNTMLIMMAMLVPAIVLILAAMVVPAAVILGLPLLVLSGGIVTRLSVKLPAVALGNAGFGFRDAWAATKGNFWPCAGVFLLNAAILIGLLFAVIAVAGILAQASLAVSLVFQLVVTVLLQLFYTVFNASIFTSLYGFFVERRDF